VAAVQATYPEAHVEVWATDEHRVGLKPVLTKVWARKGERPIARVQHRFAWRYVLAFVHPASGRTEWQFASGINTAVMSVALRYFALAVGASPSKRIVLALDQAGYHVSPQLQVPEGIHLILLPPYSPELQPAEHLWRFSDQPLTNVHFATIDDLEDTLADHCDRLQRQQDVICSATHFHWWPAF
jgi:DDE superfamily endonuclease